MIVDEYRGKPPNGAPVSRVEAQRIGSQKALDTFAVQIAPHRMIDVIRYPGLRLSHRLNERIVLELERTTEPCSQSAARLRSRLVCQDVNLMGSGGPARSEYRPRGIHTRKLEAGQ